MSVLQLLGQSAFYHGGDQLELPPERPSYLVVWLASQGGWVERSEAAGMFWPDESEQSARHNLSQLLYRSRRQPWFDQLEVEPRRLRYRGDSDVASLRHALATGDWAKATGLYRGPLLGNMTGPDLASWTDWLEAERQDLLASWTEAASSHAAELQASGKYEESANLLRKVFQQDQLAEGVLQSYLQAAALAGQRTAGLAAFRDFSDLLASELGLSPLPETGRLAEQLQEAVPVGGTATGGSGLLGAPAQLSAFIARELELAQLTGELQKTDTRLLTVTGPGGMGKTRLALQAGQQLAADFNTAVFVPLSPLQSAADLPLAIATALGLGLNGELDPATQLSGHLGGRSTLLVLDNFEHLVAAAPTLAQLLEAAAGLKVLVTSREPLGLRGEQLFELEGLSLPSGPADPQFEDHGAVQLLLRNAARLQPGLELGPADRPAVYRIVKLLAGLPLGIELAAPWLRLLPVEDLAGELESSLDLLQAAEATDLPDRHRSLRAAFEHTWRRLSGQERRASSRLAVFRGRFSRQAAAEVAGADLPVLLSLVNRSLLRRVAGGYFQLHQPARQYALDQLHDKAEVRDQHAAYLAGQAVEAEAAMHGSGQQDWLNRLMTERDDYLAAIAWCLETDNATLGLTIATALQPLWWIRGPYSQGATLLQALLDLPSGRSSPMRARGLHRAGTLIQELSDHGSIVAMYDEALELAGAAGDLILQADIIHSQGYRLDKAGRPAEAAEWFMRSVELYRQADFTPGESASLNSLAVIRAQLDQPEEAERLFLESLRQKRELGQTQGVAYALHNLGVLRLQQGDEATARRYIGESTELKRQMGDTRGVISAQINEAVEHVEQGRNREGLLILAGLLGDAGKLGLAVFLLRSATLVATVAGSEGMREQATELAGIVGSMARSYGLEPYYLDLLRELQPSGPDAQSMEQDPLLSPPGQPASLEQVQQLTGRLLDTMLAGPGVGQGAPGGATEAPG